ncbi:MAG: SGNH/GDSL hydrolase family protein [Bryobacteraceae bacterium]
MKTAFGILTFLIAAILGNAADDARWIGTWGASPAPQLESPALMFSNHLLFANQTIREIVHTSAAGRAVRVRLSNAYGREPVTIGAAHIALRQSESTVVAGSDRPLTFGGRTSVFIPTNATVLSDPVEMEIPASSDVAISLFLPKATAGAGIHYLAQQTSYVGSGNLTASPSILDAVKITSWVFLTGLDVSASPSAATVVAFGDSITDGARSTVDANRRWPNILANRLVAQKSGISLGVLDEGIGGNRLLHDPAVDIHFGVNALARFTRDVLAQPGVRYVIVLEGINDIGHPGQSAPIDQAVTAEDIIAAYKQLIERAHEAGLKIFGATLTPFAGTTTPGYFTPEKELKRKAVNEWIRTSHSFDGVIDFDKAVRDPQNPDRMLARYDGGDLLHPGDAGYQAMGEAIDLSLFR